MEWLLEGGLQECRSIIQFLFCIIKARMVYYIAIELKMGEGVSGLVGG